MQSVSGLQTSTSRGAVRSQLLHLAWPVIAEQLLITLTSMVDMALVGHLNAESIAAIGLTQTPHWLMVGLFAGLGVGVNALVARFHGAGDERQIEPASRAGFWLGIGFATLASVLVYFTAPWLMALFHASDEVMPLAVSYLRWLTPGMVAAYWMMVMSAGLRATGDTRTPLMINVGVNLLNIPLAWMLIYGTLGAPALGVAGAGIGTTVARLAGGVALFWVMARRRDGARLELGRLWQFDFGLMKRILRIGSVAASERMLSTFIYMAYAYMVNSLGTIAQAAQTVTVVAENVSWMFASGFSMATAAMVGQRLGARRPDLAELVIKEATKLCCAGLGILGLIFIFVPGPYLAIFTSDPEVLALATVVLRIAGLTEMATAVVLTLNGALSGAGETRPLFIVSIAGGVVRLSMSVLFIYGFNWGLSGAWLAAGVDWLVRAALIWLRFRKGTWKTVSV